MHPNQTVFMMGMIFSSFLYPRCPGSGLEFMQKDWKTVKQMALINNALSGERSLSFLQSDGTRASRISLT